MAGTLRLSNTGTGNGQSTITTAASGDTTYTLPSGGGTFVTTASTQALTVPFASGTAGAPSVTFIGDTDTGLYSPGANQVALSTSGTNRVHIDSSGNVGVGTTSPATLHHVAGTQTVNERTTYKQPDNTTDVGNIGRSSLFILGGGTNDMGISSADALLFAVNGTSEAARIDSSGRLLVGTTSVVASDVKLEVRDGILAVTDSSGGDVRVFLGGSTSPNHAKGQIRYSLADDSLEFYSNGAERMRIHSSGNTSIIGGALFGGTTDPGSSVKILSTVIGSGAGTHFIKWSNVTGNLSYDSSSKLIKENIEDCAYGLNEVKQLQPRKYFRTDDQREEIGFIADEVISVLPEFVSVGPKSVITKNEDDTESIPLAINYDKLTAVLTKALQEAVAKIENMESRLTAAGL